MTKPVNLNKARKEQDRSSRKARADANAVRFGQSKAQKEALRAAAERISRNLDGHKKGE